MMVILEARRAH